jgi:OmpA-OmpF porin, OOP family
MQARDDTLHRRGLPQRLAALTLAAVLVAALAAPGAVAGEVRMYRGEAPPADELADIVFPQATRSIGQPRGIGTRPQEPEPAREPAPEAFGFNINFAFDSAEIQPESRPYLDKVGEMMRLDRSVGKALRIVGHTDATGPEDYNQELSERRAEAVRAYLQRGYGVAPERLQVVGMGKRQPLDPANPTDGVNRRVEFHPGDG